MFEKLFKHPVDEVAAVNEIEALTDKEKENAMTGLEELMTLLKKSDKKNTQYFSLVK